MRLIYFTVLQRTGSLLAAQRPSTVPKLICCNASVSSNTQVSEINHLIITCLLVSHQKQNHLSLHYNKDRFAFFNVPWLEFCIFIYADTSVCKYTCVYVR